eukprot:CAMPEP_0185747970 /NCGR_PEP_ID=MMETSP1174-20130828/6621_1 /TAXON_ID=35687 /ORGANISM="Dictyocha speculum, Strain CCMP1381" /LENGTH=59 /DNA_ID=CAMNT_0028423411 /DNA_START=24 /DNA_END=203 /DNA_ORIENTATION=+
MKQGDVLPPLSDRPGIQERRQERRQDDRSGGRMKDFVRRGVYDLKRPPLRGCLDLERGV